MEIDIKNIAVIGYGKVGKAVRDMFASHYKVIVYDTALAWSSFNGSKEIINQECIAAFVCVPTPSLENGRCDTSIVEEVVGWLSTPLIVIKSTVEPGTTRRLQEMYPDKHIVFSPEFSGQGTYHSPYKFQQSMIDSDYYIFGGYTEDTSQAIALYLPVTGPNKQYIQCNPSAAELAKYITNTFLALKVTFCHEMYDLCRETGIDWNTVRELWLLDPRVTRSHTAIFTDTGKPSAVTGTCFPKDVLALLAWANSRGECMDLLAALKPCCTPTK